MYQSRWVWVEKERRPSSSSGPKPLHLISVFFQSLQEFMYCWLYWFIVLKGSPPSRVLTRESVSFSGSFPLIGSKWFFSSKKNLTLSGLRFISNKKVSKWDLQYLTKSRDESIFGANFVFCAFLFLHRLVSSPLSMLTGQLELSGTVEEFQTCHYLQDWVWALQFSGRSGIISQNWFSIAPLRWDGPPTSNGVKGIWEW